MGLFYTAPEPTRGAPSEPDLHYVVPADLVLVGTQRTHVVVALEVHADVLAGLVDKRRRVGDQVAQQDAAELGRQRRGLVVVAARRGGRPQQPVVGVLLLAVAQDREPIAPRLQRQFTRSCDFS